MFFGLRHNTLVQCRPIFSIDTQPIEYVSSYFHLGNILDDTQSDAECIAFRRKQFVGQLNNVPSAFCKQEHSMQVELLHTF
jgi:hypothetical protein